MTQPEHVAHNQPVKGEFADFSLVNQDELREYLRETQGGVINLYRSQPDTFPYPVEDFEMSFTCYEKDYPELHSGFTLSPLCLNSFDLGGSWQKVFKKLLTSYFAEKDLEIYTLKHEQSCIHVRISEVYSVRIALGSTTSSGTVDISLEPLDDLVEASEGNITFDPKPEDCEEPDIIETMRQFSQATSLVVDSAIGMFGEPMQEKMMKPTITIAPPSNRPEPEMKIDSENMANGFESVGGMENAKQVLNEIALAFKYPDEARLYGIEPQHVLIHGIEGTGKSSLVKAFVAETGANLRTIHSRDVVEKWVGGSAKKLRKIFEEAMEETGLQVIFFEEFNVLGKKGSRANDERASVTKELGPLIDEISENHPNIIVLCAANGDREDFEASLIRPGRLRTIEIGMPTEAERLDIWGAVFADSLRKFGYGTLNKASEVRLFQGEPFNPYEDDVVLAELARLTDGMVGAHFVEILHRARSRKFTEFLKYKDIPGNTPECVSHQDIVNEIKQFTH